jgi:indolepyruvate ferredoxin oxidoreductase alpha subunit
VLHQKLDRDKALVESSSYNFYRGPEKPEVLIITGGSGWMYSLETVSTLKLQDRVGLLKLSTTWPLPRNLVLKHLKQADAILSVEEVDPFLENNVKELYTMELLPSQRLIDNLKAFDRGAEAVESL